MPSVLWELSPEQKESASSVIFSIDGHDEGHARAWERFLPDTLRAIKVSEEYIAKHGVVKASELRRGKVFLDMRSTIQPDKLMNLLRAICVGARCPAFISIHAAAGPKSIELAARTITQHAGDEKPILVASSVPSDMTEETCQQIYGLDIKGLFSRQVAMAHEAGATAVLLSIGEVGLVPAGMTKIMTGVRRSSDTSPSRHARKCTISEAHRAGADLLVIGSTVTTAGDQDRAVMEVFDELALARKDVINLSAMESSQRTGQLPQPSLE